MIFHGASMSAQVQDGTQPHPQHNERSNAQPDLTAANIKPEGRKMDGVEMAWGNSD